MSLIDLLLDSGYEDVILLDNYLYDTALIGVSDDNRAIYDYNKMVEWLIKESIANNITDAIEWIECNTIKSLSYMDDKIPIIMYPLERFE